MSYILEALKKAQAERQLCNAPTIHAPTLHTAPAHVPSAKKTGALAAGLVAAVLLATGAWLWSQRVPAPVAIPATAMAPAPAPVVAPAPAPAPAPVPAAALAPAPATVVVPPPVIAAAPAPLPRKVPTPTPTPTPAPAATPVVPSQAEDNVRYARDLPQELQQQLPRVTFGGYMYSDYAADRLVLVDKTLRHEGEEIAPGLMLEKLLPRGAVLNYRGTRYRVNF
ncbi:MAG: general secretion pathway protein GspB [Pseudomonadota bacterium]|nr:general secretion pathway protein GspB [Pseudomonadota bacterium]